MSEEKNNNSEKHGFITNAPPNDPYRIWRESVSSHLSANAAKVAKSPFSDLNAELGISEDQRREKIRTAMRQLVDAQAVIETCAPAIPNLTHTTCIICFADTGGQALSLLDDPFGDHVCRPCWKETHGVDAV